MKKLYWKIIGRDGFSKVYEKEIPAAFIGEQQMASILRCLAAKANLDNDEIVGAFARRRSKYPMTFCM